MQIVILSAVLFLRTMIENQITDNTILSFNDHAIISILDTEDLYLRRFKSNHKNVLNLKFSDIDKNENIPGLTLFNKLHAQLIIDFINVNKNVKCFIIHCLAGISRSGAIGTFIDLLYDNNYTKLRELNPSIILNIHVLQVLRHVYDKDNCD